MAKLTIYTRSYCPYCTRAMSVLKGLGITEFEEISIDGRERELRQKLVELTNGRWDVPQVFVGDQYIGDDDALVNMAQSGALQRMLTGDA